MAGPITHVVFALIALNGPLKHFDKKEFIIGTSFPDIRYLGVIERNKTHKLNATLNDVLQAASAFKAGILFHSLVDRLRQTFMAKEKIYEMLPPSPYITQCFKFYEDMQLYEKISNWNEIAQYFNSLLPEQKKFNIEEKHLKQWHIYLKAYLLKKPTVQLFIKQFLLKIMNTSTTFSQKISKQPPSEIKKTMHPLKQQEKVNIILERFYNYIITNINDNLSK